MPKKEISLRESTLKMLKAVFEQLLSTLQDTPSKPVIKRELTLSFNREKQSIGQLCDEMESDLQAHRESRLSVFRKVVDAAADKITTILNKSGELNPSELRDEFDRFKKIQADDLQEMGRQDEKFVERWRQEFAQRSGVIINRFHDDAVRIMMQGVVADHNMDELDPNTSPKQ